MRTPFLLIFIVLASQNVWAQFVELERKSRTSSKNNIAYLEVGGATGLFSINADVLLQENLYLRVGTTFLPAEDSQNNQQIRDAELPLRLVLGLYRQLPMGNAFFEAGAAVVVGPPDENALVYNPPAFVFLFGVRWDIPVEDAAVPMIGLSINPAISSGGLNFIPGLKIGFKL